MSVVKLVVVGEHGVGKTCMMASYVNNSFPEDDVPTLFENHNKHVLYENQTVVLSLWDTAGHEAYNLLRPLSYPETSVFMICYSFDDAKSLLRVKKWYDEIKAAVGVYGEDTPIFLVGNKIDKKKEFSKEELQNALDELIEEENQKKEEEEKKKEKELNSKDGEEEPEEEEEEEEEEEKKKESTKKKKKSKKSWFSKLFEVKLSGKRYPEKKEKTCRPFGPLFNDKVFFRSVDDISADQICKDLKLSGHLECSAKTQEGLKNVFNFSIGLTVRSRYERGGGAKK